MEQMPQAHHRVGIQDAIDEKEDAISVAQDDYGNDVALPGRYHPEEIRVPIEKVERLLEEAENEAVHDDRIFDANMAEVMKTVEALEYKEIINTAEKLFQSIEALENSVTKQIFLEGFYKSLKTIENKRSRTYLNEQLLTALLRNMLANKKSK